MNLSFCGNEAAVFVILITHVAVQFMQLSSDYFEPFLLRVELDECEQTSNQCTVCGFSCANILFHHSFDIVSDFVWNQEKHAFVGAGVYLKGDKKQ